MTRRRSRRVEKLILPLVAAATVSATLAAPASGDELAAAPRGVPVTSVADGDTITVKISGRAEKVRLIGLDTPEAGECFAKESTRATTSLVKGKSVRLVSDKSQPNRDRYGRLLRHVVLTDGRRVAPVLIAGGYGWEFKYGNDYQGRAAHTRAEARAIKAKAGMWRGCRDLTRKITVKGKCRIAGNISKGEKIYHLPGGRSFQKVTINTRQGVRWFCTQLDARKAGWRKAKA